MGKRKCKGEDDPGLKVRKNFKPEEVIVCLYGNTPVFGKVIAVERRKNLLGRASAIW